MPIRNSPHVIEDLGDLSHLDELVVDKRYGQRASAKKNRRNRHYEKQFIRNSLAQFASGLSVNASVPSGEAVDEPAPDLADRTESEAR